LSSSALPHWSSIHTLVFDFDGVFTDNKVYVDQSGNESIRADRADGLAFDILRLLIERERWNLDYFILSTEANPVVSARASKLKIKCVQGVSNKADYLKQYLLVNSKNPMGMIYIGNDLNDLACMALASVAVSPSDAHPLIRQRSTLTLPQNGGDGFVRAFIEELIGLDKMSEEMLISLLQPAGDVQS